MCHLCWNLVLSAFTFNKYLKSTFNRKIGNVSNVFNIKEHNCVQYLYVARLEAESGTFTPAQAFEFLQ